MADSGKSGLSWEMRFEALAVEADPRRRSDLVQALASDAGPEDLEKVAECLLGESGRERFAALQVTYHVSRRESEELRRSSRIVEALGSIAEREFPTSGDGVLAWKTLARLAPERAKPFVDPARLQGLTDQELRRIAGDVWCLGRTEAVRVLETIKGLGGTAGKLAESQIKLHMGPSEEQLRLASEAWRRKRSSKTLGELYYDFVSRQRLGTPLSRLVEVLGEPSGRDETLRSVWWASKEGRALVVALDLEERTQSYSLSD